MSSYLVAIASLALIYSLLAYGLNLQWGHTGIINFGHAAFFATGAYASALLTRAGFPIIIGIIAGMILAGLFAIPIGRLTLRLKEDYLSVVTIGFSEVVRLTLLNSKWSGGANGLTGIPRIFAEFGRDLRPIFWFFTTLAIVLAVYYLLQQLIESPFGRVLRAIRCDEVAVSSLGKDVAWFRMTTLVFGSMLAGLAGSLYAHWVGFVVPDQFTTAVTFATWTGIALGGSNHFGAVAGTVLLVSLLEATRFLGDFGIPIDMTLLANLRFVLVGLLLVIILQVKPKGLLPYRHKTLIYKNSKAEKIPE